jgi:20S proteasome alpha/beta subunit
MGGQPYFSALAGMQQAVRNVLAPAFSTAAQAQKLLGPVAQSEAICGCLLAPVFSDGLKLIEISPQGGFEYLSHDVPYVCIGSGKANADPFIKFLWSVYWRKNRPSVQGAVLTAYWTVKATIEAHTSGVGYSPDVALLAEDGAGGYSVKVYSNDELLEHDGFIEQAHDALRAVRDRILDRSPAGTEEVAGDPPPMLDPPVA